MFETIVSGIDGNKIFEILMNCFHIKCEVGLMLHSQSYTL